MYQIIYNVGHIIYNVSHIICNVSQMIYNVLHVIYIVSQIIYNHLNKWLCNKWYNSFPLHCTVSYLTDSQVTKTKPMLIEKWLHTIYMFKHAYVL